MHQVLAHGRTIGNRRYVNNSRCSVRHRDYVTRARAIKHVSFDSVKCKRALAEQIANGSAEMVMDDEFAAVEKETRAAGVALRRSGRHTFAADRASPVAATETCAALSSPCMAA